jgi:single-strand DNA-binding protein
MAASNVNVVILTGNLTKKPEIRETGTGVSVCELRLACNVPVKKDGIWESRANYFQVNTWGGMAENCEKFLDKGSKVAIQGRLEWQKWEAKDGSGTNSRVVVVANQVEFLDSKNKGNTPTPPTDSSEPTSSSSSEDDIPF